MDQAEDVEVILAHKHRYKFHSGTLARSSTLFADLLTEPNAAKLGSRGRNSGVKIRWVIELTCLPCDAYPAGRLELVDATSVGKRTGGRIGLIVNENGRIPKADEVIAHYEAILYSFYGKEIIIDDTDMAAALDDCYSLLQITDYLGCTRLVSKPIEIALLKHGQGIFRSIQNSPSAWAELAYRVRSELLFTECVIHLVGNWKVLKQQRSVTDHIREVPGLRSLIDEYHRKLLFKCKQVELRLMSHYPGTMRLPVEDLPIKREAYAKDILVWMALTFYRHWVGQQLITERGHQGDDCGYELFQQIAAGGEAYMDRAVINQFHTRFPMTKKAMNVLENHLMEIKACMKDLIAEYDILEPRCQLDVKRFAVKYLTCTEFKREDLPWASSNQIEPAPITVPRKREYKPSGNEIARQTLNTARMGQESNVSVEIAQEEEDEYDLEFDEEREDLREPTGKRSRLS